MTSEAKDVAAAILGPHPDEFFASMGRIVCVAAVLEDKITSLRHALASAHQGEHTQQSVSTQIAKARRHLSRLQASDADVVSSFLDSADAAFKKRNDYVHSSFPAQPSGELWGHRPTRNKQVMDGTADTVETTLEEMDLFVVDLGQLVLAFNQVFARCGNLPPFEPNV